MAEDFIQTMPVIFNYPSCERTAKATLQALRQGCQSVAKYAAEFHRLVGDTKWNMAEQHCYLHFGLNDDLKHELV